MINQGQNEIKNIESKIGDLVSIKNKVTNCSKEEEHEVTQEMLDVMNKVNESRNKLDKIIKNLKSKIESSDEEEKEDETDIRIKKNLFDAFIKKYQHTMNRFQNVETEIKKIKESNLIREAEIAINNELNEEERQKVIENPQMIQQMYANKITGDIPVTLANAVKDLEERHKDIVKLQKSIFELHQMVIELSAMVQYQGEMLDNIVDNVNIANEYVKKGEKHVIKSKENLEKARKKKCIVIIVIIIILIVILLPTLIAIFK